MALPRSLMRQRLQEDDKHRYNRIYKIFLYFHFGDEVKIVAPASRRMNRCVVSGEAINKLDVDDKLPPAALLQASR